MKLAIPVLFVVLAAGQAAAEEPRCISAYGIKACGYSCEAAYGEVKCARTSMGACSAAYGQVVCWDPPTRLRRRHHLLQPAQCKAAYGEITCGYGCVSAYGDTKCSQTPGNQCYADLGQLFCSDGS